MPNYELISVDRREARGRNGLFAAEQIEVYGIISSLDGSPEVIVQVWSRRRGGNERAPIQLYLSVDEAYDLGKALREVGGTALQAALQHESAERERRRRDAADRGDVSLLRDTDLES